MMANLFCGPYDEDCPKCGSRGSAMIYRRKGATWKDSNMRDVLDDSAGYAHKAATSIVADREFLQHTCRACGYTWAGSTLAECRTTAECWTRRKKS